MRSYFIRNSALGDKLEQNEHNLQVFSNSPSKKQEIAMKSITSTPRGYKSMSKIYIKMIYEFVYVTCNVIELQQAKKSYRTELINPNPTQNVPTNPNQTLIIIYFLSPFLRKFKAYQTHPNPLVILF